MRKLRDVFYINASIEENYFIYYGMEFKEFVKCNPSKIDNILITDGRFVGTAFNYNWWLETANNDDGISDLCKEDLYGLGNFHWIDYKDETSLDNCTPEEKAEVLYLSHFGKPLKTPFIDRINNDFFYLAHDDGWFCKLYCRDTSVFSEIISNKIIESVATNKRKIYPIDKQVKDILFELTQKGLLIDFSNIYRDNKGIYLNFYVVGKYQDMDEMYNNLERNKSKASISGRLEHRNKVWKIYFNN